MQKWEYKILEFECGGFFTGKTNIAIYIDYISKEKTSFLTGKKKKQKEPVRKPISREEFEDMLNNLGKQGWELIEALPLSGRTGFGESKTDRVHFVFKREIM